MMKIYIPSGDSQDAYYAATLAIFYQLSFGICKHSTRLELDKEGGLILGYASMASYLETSFSWKSTYAFLSPEQSMGVQKIKGLLVDMIGFYQRYEISSSIVKYNMELEGIEMQQSMSVFVQKIQSIFSTIEVRCFDNICFDDVKLLPVCSTILSLNSWLKIADIDEIKQYVRLKRTSIRNAYPFLN